MMDLDTYNITKSKYGKFASWAIWSEEDYTDASIIESSISELNPKIVFVGLNASRDVTDEVWRAFHCKHQGGSDGKLRATYNQSIYRGAYMTDILKNYV